MLAKKNRLILSKRNPTNLAKRIESGSFVLKFKSTQGPFKAAIVVSKKVAKKAVDRNRIKRTISEAIQKTIVPNLDLVIIVKENIKSKKSPEIKSELEIALKKI